MGSAAVPSKSSSRNAVRLPPSRNFSRGQEERFQENDLISEVTRAAEL